MLAVPPFITKNLFGSYLGMVSYRTLNMAKSAEHASRPFQFYTTVCCRLRHYTKASTLKHQVIKWREIKTWDTGTKNGLQALIKANQRKKSKEQGQQAHDCWGGTSTENRRQKEQETHKSDPSELRWEHPHVKAQAEGGGGNQPEQ